MILADWGKNDINAIGDIGLEQQIFEFKGDMGRVKNLFKQLIEDFKEEILQQSPGLLQEFDRIFNYSYKYVITRRMSGDFTKKITFLTTFIDFVNHGKDMSRFSMSRNNAQIG